MCWYPFFGLMSVCPWGGGCAGFPGCPGAHRLRPRRVFLLPCRWGGSCWSGGCGQGAEALPAGEEGVGPWPVGADGESSLPGVAGGQVPDPGRSVSGSASRRSASSQWPRRRVQAAKSAAMFAAMTHHALTCQVFDGRARRPMALAVRTPAVSTQACSRWTASMYWGWWLPGTP